MAAAAEAGQALYVPRRAGREWWIALLLNSLLHFIKFAVNSIGPITIFDAVLPRLILPFAALSRKCAT